MFLTPSSFILVLLAVGGLWWLLQIWMKHKRIRQMMNLLPGPVGQFIIGNALQFPSDHSEHLKTFHNLAKQFKQFGLYRLWLGPTQPVCILIQGRHLEGLMTSSRLITKSNFYKFARSWLGEGLVTSSGEKWRSRRKLLTQTFHFKILNTFMPVYNEQGRVLTECIQKHVNSHNGKPLDIFNRLNLCTLDVICETAMGIKLNAQTKDGDVEYSKALHVASKAIITRVFRPWLWSDLVFSLTPMGREHDKAITTLHAFTDDVIQKRRREWESQPKRALSELTNSDDVTMGGKGKTRLAFLDLLLEASEGGKVLSDLDIREEVDTFMFAGHDTTAAATSWALYLLGHNPDIQKKVQEELDSVFGDSDRNVTEDDLKQLKYLDCVIKESNRIYPPVPIIDRQIIEDLQLDGYTVPSGAICTIVTYVLHRDEKCFPDPERFDPDRFLPENSSGRHPYAYIPFSAGPRNCIGQKFASLEERVLLSHVLRKFNVTSMESRDDIKVSADIILRPLNGIKMKFLPRS